MSYLKTILFICLCASFFVKGYCAENEDQSPLSQKAKEFSELIGMSASKSNQSDISQKAKAVAEEIGKNAIGKD